MENTNALSRIFTALVVVVVVQSVVDYVVEKSVDTYLKKTGKEA